MSALRLHGDRIAPRGALGPTRARVRVPVRRRAEKRLVVAALARALRSER